MPYWAMALRSILISRYGLPTMRSAMTDWGSIAGTSLRNCTIRPETCSMVCRSGRNTFTPMLARMPLCSMTIRAEIGCSLGATVVPGIDAARTICVQMSSGLRIPGQACLPRLSSGSNAGRHRRNGRPSAVGESGGHVHPAQTGLGHGRVYRHPRAGVGRSRSGTGPVGSTRNRKVISRPWLSRRYSGR